MRLVIIAAIFFFFCGCKKEENKSFKVTLHFSPFYLGKLYLENLSQHAATIHSTDSAELDFKKNEVTFTGPASEESVFMIRMEGKPLGIYFINDSRDIHIYGVTPDLVQYRVANSPSNDALASFRAMQQPLIDEITQASRAQHPNENAADQHARFTHIESLRSRLQAQAIHFADTTKSPGAFLFAYNGIDFGNDFAGLDKFIRHAAARFPDHKAIQALVKSTLAYIRVFEEEYEIGDTLPQLSLADENNAMVYTGVLPRKYYYIDIWSTWCDPCLAYIPAKKELRRRIPEEKLGMIDIAIDQEKDNWKSLIQQYKLPGIHLLDENMWRGLAVTTYKFDSIPFNYLVSPEGRIIAKAIPRDSVISVVSRLVR